MIEILRETHETPENVARRLCLAGGMNRYGEANYRVVWGWNRLGWIGGKFEDRDARGDLIREVVELRWEPKYPQVNRWHVERWVPAEAYGSPRGMLLFHALCGEDEEAQRWTAKAVEQRDYYGATFAARFFQSGSHWPALAKMINLPEPIS